MPDQVWRKEGVLSPSHKSISSEVIDGEAIIMNHDSGVYFNALGSGAAIWQLVAGQLKLGTIVASLADLYQIDETAIHDDVAGFVALLVEHGLAASVDGVEGEPPTLAVPHEPYGKPELGIHTDLADLLLLDPIHDVSDTVGWPSPRDQ
jgi:hypothetical protein